MNIRADLHVHTYYSDGVMSPAEVVKRAKANGVGILAVTDHDNMLGLSEAGNACKETGVTLVHGIEISAYDHDVKIHMLGYGVDSECNAFCAFYQKLVEGSYLRAKDILQKLNASGIRLCLDEVVSQLHSPLQPVHSSNIAQAAVKKGYAGNVWQFYSDWLNGGKPAYSNLARPTPEEAIEVIKLSGGISSLAHPGRITLTTEEKEGLIARLAAKGLNGIEACYSTHTVEETVYFKEIAKQYSLLVTGGSDTHAPTGRRAIGTPEFFPSDALLDALHIHEEK